MPSFHKAWARQDTASMSDKFRDTLKPQGALKPRIQNAVNKLQAQTSKMDAMLNKLEQRDQQLFQRVVVAVQNHDKSACAVLSNELVEVRKVKKYESGVVRDPITIRSDKQVGELIQLTNDLSISGMPVVDDGELVGIVTSRDFRNERNLGATVAEIMTPKNKLVTAKEGEDLEVIKALLQDNRIEKILLVDEKFELTGLVTLKDINKFLDFIQIDFILRCNTLFKVFETVNCIEVLNYFLVVFICLVF